MRTGEDICPTCGVDVARAAMVTAVAMFYRMTYQCPRCLFEAVSMQGAIDHMAEQHEPDLFAYFQRVTS